MESLKVKEIINKERDLINYMKDLKLINTSQCKNSLYLKDKEFLIEE